MAANSFYNHGTTPPSGSLPISSPIRAEFDLITNAFSLCPVLTSNNSKAVVINAASGALVVTTGTLDLAGNLATTGGFATTFTQQATTTQTLPSASGPLATLIDRVGFLTGLTLANNAGDTVNDIDIATGSCMSEPSGAGQIAWDNLALLTLSGALTKRLDASFVAGTNQGGLSSSLTLTNSTTYQVYVIRLANGTIDVGFDSDNTSKAVNLIADHGVTHYRRIGSIFRNTTTIGQFVQTNDTFMLVTPATGTSADNPGTAELVVGPTAANTVIPTTLGGNDFKVIVTMGIDDTAPAGVIYMYLRQSGASDQAATQSNCSFSSAGGTRVTNRTNITYRNSGSLGAVRARLSASHAGLTVKVVQYGWIDSRGRERS